jgi:hypothetical protein
LNKKAIADRDWRDGDPSAPKTPWGPAQNAYQLARGVIWYSTAGHGGLAVATGVARSLLTPAALMEGEKWGSYFWYEEDIGWAIPFYEHPEWEREFVRKAGGSVYDRVKLEETIRRWFPKYLENIVRTDLKHAEKLRVGDVLKVTKDLRFRSGFVLTEGMLVKVDKVTSSKIYLHVPNQYVDYVVPDSYYYDTRDQRFEKVDHANLPAELRGGPFNNMSDAELNRYITEFENQAPENFWMDGELQMSRSQAYTMYRKRWRSMTVANQIEYEKEYNPKTQRFAKQQENVMNRDQIRPLIKQAMMNLVAEENVYQEISYYFPKVTKQVWASMSPVQKYTLFQKNAGTSALYPMGLDEAAIKKGWGLMMYNIDEGANHSKFYEALIVPQGGGYRVFVRWGALTDVINERTSKGQQFDDDPRYFSDSEMGAKRILNTIRVKRISHGYSEVDTFKGGKGFYPVGLNRQAPFAWGNQQIAYCVPSLKHLEEQLQTAKQELVEQGQTMVLKDALETAFEAIRDVAPDSEMGRELLKQIGTPLRRLTPVAQGRFKNPLDAKKLLASVNAMLRFLDAQLVHCR